MRLAQIAKEHVPKAVLALLCILIVHIVATLIPAYLSTNTAFMRLSAGLPVNQFVVLPPARPSVQVLPYQQPNTRYAICKFDARQGSIALKAELPATGWTLSVYTKDGTSFYDAPGRADGTTKVDVLLRPPGGLFMGIRPIARVQTNKNNEIVLPANQGIIVIRAPLGGIAYAQQTERAISGASCQLRPFSSS